MALGKRPRVSITEAHEPHGHRTSNLPLNILRTVRDSDSALPGHTDDSKALPDFEQTGPKSSLGTRKEITDFIVSPRCQNRQCFVKSKRESADVDPSFLGSRSFLSWNKAW